jgi:hypothetical protein
LPYIPYSIERYAIVLANITEFSGVILNPMGVTRVYACGTGTPIP